MPRDNEQIVFELWQAQMELEKLAEDPRIQSDPVKLEVVQQMAILLNQITCGKPWQQKFVPKKIRKQ